ncbi:unnamed protein product [Prunus brigantina]
MFLFSNILCAPIALLYLAHTQTCSRRHFSQKPTPLSRSQLVQNSKLEFSVLDLPEMVFGVTKEPLRP